MISLSKQLITIDKIIVGHISVRFLEIPSKQWIFPEKIIFHTLRLIKYLIILQNFPQSTTLLYSSAAAPQKKIDDEKLNHEDVLVTKVATIHPIQTDIAKVLQNEVKIQTNQVTNRKEPELPWRITPSTDSSNLVKHYLMLSKIRLTCKSI